jgi:hypothetical protein
LLHAAFRHRLATTPWRFAITSPPSGCEGDLHPKAVKHARHTKKRPGGSLRASMLQLNCLLDGFFCFERGFGLLDEAGKARCILDGDVGEDLAIQLDARLF